MRLLVLLASLISCWSPSPRRGEHNRRGEEQRPQCLLLQRAHLGFLVDGFLHLYGLLAEHPTAFFSRWFAPSVWAFGRAPNCVFLVVGLLQLCELWQSIQLCFFVVGLLQLPLLGPIPGYMYHRPMQLTDGVLAAFSIRSTNLPFYVNRVPDICSCSVTKR